MINGSIENFLDTGWYNESTLFYNGYVYWLEAVTDFDTKENSFFVNKWKAKCVDNQYYISEIDDNGECVDWSQVISFDGVDLDLIKKSFLEAPIFEGKTFWETEKEIVWVDEIT